MNHDLIPVEPVAVTRRGRIVWHDGEGRRELGPRAQKLVLDIAAALLIGFGLLMLGLATGVVPAAPWSPIGQAEQPVPPAIDLGDFDIPEGWQPAVPPQAPVQEPDTSRANV